MKRSYRIVRKYDDGLYTKYNYEVQVYHDFWGLFGFWGYVNVFGSEESAKDYLKSLKEGKYETKIIHQEDI